MKQEKIYTVEIDEWNKRQMEELFAEIECSHNWKSIEKIAKGWSSDEKYKVITKQGENLLIRLASIDKYEEKKKEFDIITKPTNTKIEKKILQLSRYESSKV